MPLWTLLFLVPGQQVDSEDFPKALQMKAVTATVRIVNRSDQTEGTGVILGRKGASVYVLTAAHLVKPGARLEVSTFTEDSYPSPEKTYDKAEVIERTRDARDLALLRLSTKDRLPGVLSLTPPREIPPKGGFEALSVGIGAVKAPLCLLEKVQADKEVRRRGLPKARFWVTALEQAQGRSGGPLLDRHGHILGLASGASDGSGYYTHALEIRNWLKANSFEFLLEGKAGQRVK